MGKGSCEKGVKAGKKGAKSVKGAKTGEKLKRV